VLDQRSGVRSDTTVAEGSEVGPVDERSVAISTRNARSHRRPKIGKLWLWLTDVVAVIIAMVTAATLGVPASDASDSANTSARTAVIVAVLGTLVVLTQQGAYATRRISMRRDEYPRVFKGVVGGLGATILLGYLFDFGVPEWLLAYAVTGTILVLVNREIQRQVFRRLRKGRRLVRRAVIVGADDHASTLSDMLTTSQELGYDVVGIVDLADVEDRFDRDGLVDRIGQITAKGSAGTVLVATSAVDHLSTGHLTRRLTDMGLHVELCVPLQGIDVSRLRLRPLGQFPVIYVEPVSRSGWRQYAKRTFDATLATLGLIVTLPLLLLAAAAIKLDSRGPVIFRQWRVGRDGSKFQVLKLRTMTDDAESRLEELRTLNEASGPTFKIKGDPRITRVGRVLRKLSIDELPQLWNVLRGEMSVVGPRPALPSEMEGWNGDLFERLRVRPGITGMWQVNGRSNASGGEYLRLDLYYVDNWSLLMDMIIVLKTFPAVVSGRGAY
jgi:exopolysaccharide biosynthesis polyprenyl glycosylphosphotransferase